MKPEKKAIAISEEGKGILAILKSSSPILLNELKGQSGLSNKKWDKTNLKEEAKLTKQSHKIKKDVNNITTFFHALS